MRPSEQKEAGVTLIELLASVLIGSMIIVAILSVGSSVINTYRETSQAYSKFADSSNLYFMLQKLAQNTISMGTINSSNVFTTYYGSTNVLALHVFSLAGIIPASSSLNNDTGTTKFICAEFLPDPNTGYMALTLFPGGVTPQPSNEYQIDTNYTDFNGSVFNIINSSSFSVSLNRQVVKAGSYVVNGSVLSPSSVVYQFIIGGYSF